MKIEFNLSLFSAILNMISAIPILPNPNIAYS